MPSPLTIPASVKKLLGDSQKRKLKKYEQLVQEINNLEEKLSDLSDEELRRRTFAIGGNEESDTS
ncbi:hypothetical protein bcgnr5373_59070 [Bacillus cereus]